MQKYKSNIITTTGLAQRNISVRVLDDNGALAALYADRYGQTPIANPQVTAVDGTFAFYAANGRYSLQTTINGVTYTDQDVVLAADPEDMLVAGPIADAVNNATASVLATAIGAASAAQASQNAAAGSQGAAAASASNAAGSASAAAGSASAASGSAATASGAAGAASASEANAHASENAAATSAGNAATSESNALASKNAAAAAAANAATYAQGYANGGAYAAGITLNDRFTFVAKDGELYRVADSVALPYTTTGNWAVESSKFVSIGDRVLRQSLADPAQGIGLIASAVRAVATITELRAVPHDPEQVVVSGYYSISDGGGGLYRYDSGDAISPDNGGTVIIANDGSRWKLVHTGQVSVKQFGAKGDGIANDTSAMQAAMDTPGISIVVPDGTYVVDTLRIPNSDSDNAPSGFEFRGTRRTILQQNNPSNPVLAKTTVAGRSYHAIIGPFCVMPHASGSTMGAIYTSGLTTATFDDIQGLSNGDKGFASLFNCSAYPALSYFNTFNRPSLIGQKGYTRVFEFTDGGMGDAYNSNANVINSPSIYNNDVSLLIAIDAVRSYGTVINAPFIEANVNANAIDMGSSTTVIGGSLEANRADFNYGTSATHDCVVIGTTLANPHDVNFGGASKNNLWIGVQEISPQTWENLPDNSNRKIKLHARVTPNTPGMSKISGSGNLAVNDAVVVKPLDPLTGEVTYWVQFIFAASAASTAVVKLNDIAGFVLKSANWGCVSNAGSVALSCGSPTDRTAFYFVPTGATDAMIISVLATFVDNDVINNT